LKGEIIIGKREENKIKHYQETHKTIGGIEYKRCTKCKEFKPMTEEYFYKWSHGTVDNFHPRCANCCVEDVQKRREKDPEYQAKLARDSFNRRFERDQKLKERQRKTSKESRLKGKQKEWQQNNPERVRELSKRHRNHDITDNEWNSCLKIFNNSCCYCGVPNDEQYKKYKQVLHKDHVEHDGYNDIRNAAPACRGCNDRKWQHNMESWFREQEFFSEERLNFIQWWITEGYKDYIEEKPPYKVTRSRIYNDDGSYIMQHELWTVDKQRNMIECIYIGNKKKDVEKKLNELLNSKAS
jgi:hypothetical protein